MLGKVDSRIEDESESEAVDVRVVVIEELPIFDRTAKWGEGSKESWNEEVTVDPIDDAEGSEPGETSEIAEWTQVG